MNSWLPKSFSCLRKGYTGETFKKDLLAGLTVAVISVPLAMAFAIASGVTPDRGLFTAIIAGFLISALGGSRYQIGGPTGAFVVILYSIVQKTGYEGLAISSLLAGLLILLMGIFRLGSWIKYIPHPLVTGFTTGIAVVIFSSQIKDFFGLQMGAVPADFIAKWEAYWHHFPTLHLPTLLLALGTLSTIIAIRRWMPKLPWGISAILVATAVCQFFHLDVETIQSKFGQIPHSLPLPAWPSMAMLKSHFSEIVQNALAIAFLGGIESLLSCVIADGMTGGRHRPNTELIGQGIGNIASVFFGGIPATGAIARTAANVKSGAQTPVAGMINAVALLLILVFFAPVVSWVTLGALAAVLMMVAWNMSELHHFMQLFKAKHTDVLTMMTAFSLTVFVDITSAIFVSMFLACLSFMKEMSEQAKPIHTQAHPYIWVYEIEGPLFFGATDLFKKLQVEPFPKVFVLRLQRVPLIDASGMHAIREFSRFCKRKNIALLLAEIPEKVMHDLHQFGVVHQIGDQHIFSRADEAIAKARSLCPELTA
ncbi:MAG: STAS domain-containing protein [Chlamydiia bacterium]|nr:STAS domain-containing protein [Chlamydiia bacterium]